MPRTLERMAHERAQGVDAWRPRARGPVHQPIITVSRLPGSGGDALARQLAEELGYELYDQRLIHEIAVSSHHSEGVVATLDERSRDQLTEWLTDLLTTERFSPHDYRFHLCTVVGALARRGAAVVVGRGAHLMVTPPLGLRVLAVAPLEARVRNVAAELGTSEAHARHVVEDEERQRRYFLKAHFHAELADPSVVDVVVNVDSLGLRGATDTVRAAVAALLPRPAALEHS